MKKLCSICLIFALLCTLMSFRVSAATDEIKYDFNSPEELNDWQTVGGSWKIEDGSLKQTSGTPGSWNMHCCLKDVQVKDFTVRFRVKITKENLGTGWAALYFRKLNLTDNQEQSGYGLTMEGKSSKGKTVLVDWSHSSKTFEGQCRANGNDWNEIVLAVSGNVIDIYMNDDIATKTPTLHIVDTDNGWVNAGYMSLAAGNAKIEVDYFYLYTGVAQDKAFGGGTASTEPTDTEPTDPVNTEPEDTEPEDTEPGVTDPAPTDPPTEPTDPPTEPTDPPTEPTDPPTEPTDPATEPTNAPTDPKPTDPQPTESKPNDSKPEPDNNPLSLILLIVGAGGITCVVVIYLVSNKRKKG